MFSRKLIGLVAVAAILGAGVVFRGDLVKQYHWTLHRDVCPEPPKGHGWHRPADQPAQAGYDPLNHIEGYEIYAGHFISAGTPAEVAERKRQIVCMYGLAGERLVDPNQTLAERQKRQPKSDEELRQEDAQRNFLRGLTSPKKD